MEVLELLNLFDSYWFQSNLLTPKHPFSTITPNLELNKQNLESNNEQILELHEQNLEPPKQNLEFNEQNLETTPKLSRIPTLMVRSQSDQCLSCKDCTFNSEKSQSPSPKALLLVVEPKLQPILSGKECNEFQFSSKALEGCVRSKENFRRKKRKNKSLSELEFEELKGFMDLGFEFTDKDKDSKLVTIIPGLRRLGKENEFEEITESGISRPHLSEAWDVWEEKKKYNILKSWRINSSDFGNEMEVKDQLKLWAHSVASTVR